MKASTEQNIPYTGRVAIRMAWSFGQRSPVLCTVLGDEPLFTIEETPDETDLLDELMLALELEAALAETTQTQNTSAQQLTAFDRIERVGHHIDSLKPVSVETALDSFMTALNAASLSPVSFSVSTLLEHSQSLRSMHALLAKRGVKCVESANVAEAFYDRAAKTILVNPHASHMAGNFGFVRAARQAELHTNGCLLDPLHFQPEDAVLINRIYEVDALAHALTIAWEMNVAGRRDMWLHLLGTGNYDLAISFAREAMNDFRTIQNGKALHAVLEAWFFSGRCRAMDQALIRDLLARDTSCSFVADSELKQLGRDLICRIGERANGENYLRVYVEELLSNPLFTDVRDRSSANFMWFLKFERQFRAHEEVLEAEKKKQAEIISFPTALITPFALPSSDQRKQ